MIIFLAVIIVFVVVLADVSMLRRVDISGMLPEDHKKVAPEDADPGAGEVEGR